MLGFESEILMAYIMTLGTHFREGVAIVSGRSLFSSCIIRLILVMILIIVIRIIIIIM